MQAELSGFQRVTRQGIQLNVNQNARVDIRMEVGTLSQEVKVTGGARWWIPAKYRLAV